jgi:2-polyprenyl-3-methyl-5-hydroxy-6-metoxy-1,4-benzoquinol methylase
MDFLSIYTRAFGNLTYSAEHHIQYDYVLKNIFMFGLKSNKIIDIGSGRGHIIRLLNSCKERLEDFSITSVDLKKFHGETVDEFIPCDLSKPDNRGNLLNKHYDILVCTDVFEHLEKSFIEDTIKMCAQLSKKCIFCIANHSDVFDGVELHLIQESDLWWENILNKYFNLSNKEVHFGGRLYNYVAESKLL